MSVDRWTVAGLLVAVLVRAVPSEAQRWTPERPDGHAPIGVRADHLRPAGQVTVSYRFTRVEMEGIRAGTDALTSEDVFGLGYLIVPLAMRTDAHLIDATVAASDRVSVTLTLPFVSASTDHLAGTSERFATESSGVGDVEVAALVRLQSSDRKAAHVHLGVGLPTGSIEERDATPVNGSTETLLPYPMQVGSGTFDLRPGVTFLGQSDAWSWGFQGSGVFRMGENDRGYRLGHRGGATGWLAWKLGDRLSASARIEGESWGDVEGEDPSLDRYLVPTADPDVRGGGRLAGGLGVNFEFGEGAFRGHRVALELRVPVYQDLDGPQLGTDWLLVAGWQYTLRLVGDAD